MSAPAREPLVRNFKPLAHHELNGFGGMGEGMSIQIAKDGRRILWLAHETAPKNFTGVDVSDPRAPKVVVQTSLPESHMRSNSLETVDELAPDQPWSEIRSLGNVIRHEYDVLDIEIIWNIVKNDLPPLRKAVEGAIKKFESRR